MTVINSPARLPTEHGAFFSAFRMHVGLGRRWSAKAVARAIGSAHATVKDWARGKSEPLPRKLEALIDLLGPGFVSDLLGEMGYGGAFKITGKGPAPHTHAATMADALTALLHALADKRIDHTEGPALASIYRRVSSESAHFAHELEKAA